MANTDDTGHKKYPRMDLEDKDIDVRAIIKFSVVLVVTTVIIYVATVGLFEALKWWEDSHNPPLNTMYQQRSNLPPKPVLQTNATQAGDLAQFRAKEQKILKEGDPAIEKLPIEQAIDKLVEKGVESRSESEAQNFLDKAEKMPSDQSSGHSYERRLR